MRDRLVRAPRKGSVIVIEFSDGMHEYVTTPVKRVLRVAGREVFYIETVNSRYRLEVRGKERALGRRLVRLIRPKPAPAVPRRRRAAPASRESKAHVRRGTSSR